MINKNKKGFSLTELLLCAAIIGIISALGVNIAKKSTDNAYRAYFKSGYQNLYESLAEVQNRRGNNMEPAGFNAQQRRDQLAQDLRELFGTNGNGNPNNAGTTAITRNGVRYIVQESNGAGGFIISMQVPQAKTRRNQDGLSQRFDFFYNRRGNGYLIPLNNDILTNNQANPNTYNLLRFYRDTGTEGRITYDAGANITAPSTIQAQSYQTAMCAANGTLRISVPQGYTIAGRQSTAQAPNGNYWGVPANSWSFAGGTNYQICNGLASNGVVRMYTGR